MNRLKHFLSCDWGTSSFRLRLVEVEGFNTIAEAKSKHGCAATFEQWQQSGQGDEKRYEFYLAVVREHLRDVVGQIDISLTGVPLVISGMASSSIGMLELPYKEFPFSIDGSDLKTKTIAENNQFNHSITLISGAKTMDDVMRGEEVQLIGAELQNTPVEQIFLHPGTHSKHVLVVNGKAVGMKTYMTGEFFSLLSRESILSESVKYDGKDEGPIDRNAFELGVKKGFDGHLLHEAFMVRTNDLTQKMNKKENWFYLSGLLIGEEINDFPETFKGDVIVAGEPMLTDLYSIAIECLGIRQKVSAVRVMPADEITLKGQFAVFKRISDAL